MVAAVGVMLAPIGAAARQGRLAEVDPAAGAILAPVGRQAAWLTLEALDRGRSPAFRRPAMSPT